MSTIQANGMYDSGGNVITFGGGGSSSASDVTYDNTTSHLTADDVQEAIDELAASAGSGGHTIKDSTTTFTQRDNLKFTGPGVLVTDDSSGNATVVNISGGGGSADLPRADYETSPATATHVIGDIVYYNDKAYDVTSAIAIGDSLVVSSGTTVGNISERAGNLSYEVFGLPGGGGSVEEFVTQDELSNLVLTGATNTSGATIASGTCFVLNGDFVTAKADIASGATFTLNTNYEKKSVGEKLTALKYIVPNQMSWCVYSEAQIGGTQTVLCFPTYNPELKTPTSYGVYITTTDGGAIDLASSIVEVRFFQSHTAFWVTYNSGYKGRLAYAYINF